MTLLFLTICPGFWPSPTPWNDSEVGRKAVVVLWSKAANVTFHECPLLPLDRCPPHPPIPPILISQHPLWLGPLICVLTSPQILWMTKRTLCFIKWLVSASSILMSSIFLMADLPLEINPILKMTKLRHKGFARLIAMPPDFSQALDTSCVSPFSLQPN